jgi:hypothetical protein
VSKIDQFFTIGKPAVAPVVGDTFVNDQGTTREVVGVNDTLNEVTIKFTPANGHSSFTTLARAYVDSALRCDAWGAKQ